MKPNHPAHDCAQLAGQISELGHAIACAITQKDFLRALTLDQARQDILHDICRAEGFDCGEAFFKTIEQCAQDNAQMIQNLEQDMCALTKEASQFSRTIKAYLQ